MYTDYNNYPTKGWAFSGHDISFVGQRTTMTAWRVLNYSGQYRYGHPIGLLGETCAVETYVHEAYHDVRARIGPSVWRDPNVDLGLFEFGQIGTTIRDAAGSDYEDERQVSQATRDCELCGP